MKRTLALLAAAGLALGTPAARAQTPPDAVPQAAPSGVSRIAYDYTALYRSLNPSIVKVFADSGTGSGFLVADDGLLATNHHVVRNARYIAVQFSDGRKVGASAVLLDPRFDVAILRVNRSTVAGLRPLPLISGEREAALEAGTPVLAFGSPLSQTFLMTQGIISKVEPDTLLGDFLIQAGNSGGPLVSLEGEVVGINTFAEGRISGAVRVGVLREALNRWKDSVEESPEPAADLLPVLASARYPTELLKQKILDEPLDATVYRLDAGKFTVTAITPVLMGKMQVQDDLVQAQNRYKRRGKKMPGGSDPVDAPFYEWHRNAAGMLDYGVTFEIKPDFGTTAGSKWALFAAGLAGGLSGTRVQSPHLNMEFKAEFQEFRLYRDGELVQPVTPGRAVTEVAFSDRMVTFVDEAYSGMYVYAPEEFVGGKVFRLEVYDAREPGKAHKIITMDANSKLIRQIRADFAEAAAHLPRGL